MRARSSARPPRVTPLRAIDGGRCDGAPVEEVRISRTAGRNERHEPWMLEATGSLQALELDAAAAGLSLELAARLVLETALTCGDLEALGIDAGVLDAAAAHATIDTALEGQHAAYLRCLGSPASRAARDVQAPVTVGLPARLSTRLLAADLAELVDDAELARARAWETAAVISGRTISEWAPLTALALGRS